MLQESITHPGQIAQAALMDIARRPRRSSPKAPAQLKVTWSTVEMDGSALGDTVYRDVVGQLVTAFRAARSNDRDELVIDNIAPDVVVGSARVGEIQGHIERAADEAAKKIKLAAPEMRLSLRGKIYDLRFYLGQNKPGDFRIDPQI